MKLIVIGNYPPRKCGIATFTENFVKSLFTIENSEFAKELEVEVVAMDDREASYDYPPIVTMRIRQNSIEDYQKVINYINTGGFDYCHIQHEYGIFGGQDGLFVLRFIAQINIPLGVTFHSILKSPNYYQREVIYAFGVAASRIFVMNPLAIEILEHVYQVSTDKISMIEHGVPVFEPYSKYEAKIKFHWENNKILMTFGLLGRSKGIEVVIKALPEICSKFPDLIFVVLGQLHPHVIKNEGHIYIDELKKLARHLGVQNHIAFIDDYVEEESLKSYLKAADIYVTPYLNEAQITSGSLGYALSSGAAIVSTPYWHAAELLKEGRGCLFDFKDSNALKEIIINLFSDESLLNTFQKNAFNYGQKIAWPNIGQLHMKEIESIVDNWMSQKISNENTLLHYLPEFSLEHFYRLTDHTGIVQHAHYIFPNYKHGYTTDDNARALLMSTMLYRYQSSRETKKLITKFLAFLNYLQHHNGRFYNYLNYKKEVNDAEFSEDAFGRTIWALGYTLRFPPETLHFEFAKELFLKAVSHFKVINSLRGIANTLIGITHYLKIFPSDKEMKVLMFELSAKLENAFLTNSKEDWQWYENQLSYDNAMLPLALLCVSEFDCQPKYLSIAEKSMRFLEKVTLKEGRFSLVGNDNWMKKGEKKADFSQQAIDILGFVLYYGKAFYLTKDTENINKQRIAFSWFLGNNDVFIPLYDDQSKGCSDGLFENEVNRNQGAESLLAWLISFLAYKMAHLPC